MKTTFSITLILHFFSILTFTSCKKNESSKNIPACITKEIDKIKSEKVRNPPGSVWQYEYNGQLVYFIPSRCCDIPSQLFNSNCNQICSPDGGITGAGDGKCNDFFSMRKNEKLIWIDGRK